MTAALLSMDDVAGRLGVSTRCLYDVLADLNYRHPDTAWFRKVGRFRRFTPGDYRQLVEALKWRSSYSGQVHATQTKFITPVSRFQAGVLRSVRTREARALHGDMRRTTSRGYTNVIPLVVRP